MDDENAEQPSGDVIARVRQLRGVSWVWRDSEDVRSRGLTPGARDSGVIAQDVEAVFPHLTERDEGGVLRVHYNGLVGVLIEAVKELDERLRRLEQQD